MHERTYEEKGKNYIPLGINAGGINIQLAKASAWRDTNTPGRCHFLMYKNNLSLWQWYKAKSMKYMSLTHRRIFYKVDLWVTLIHYPKYNISPSNSHQDMKQNCWTIKYRSLTYIYLIRSIYVSHWPIIPTMMFIHQIANIFLFTFFILTGMHTGGKKKRQKYFFFLFENGQNSGWRNS